MKKGHALVIALLIGAAAFAGLVAATRTARLGASSQAPALSSSEIAARGRALDRAEANLRRILARPATPTGAPASAQKVIYVRPAPRVVAAHRAHGDDEESEGSEQEEGHDD